MKRRILLSALAVAAANAFAPASIGVMRRRSSVSAPFSFQQTRLHVQTSVDDTTSNTIPEFPLPESNNTALLQKIVNGTFLALCFGFALYTILNIDHGMTRGWSQSEIAMRIPLDNWSSYESALLEKPIFTKTMINVIIYLLGDWLSQTLFQGNNVLDFDVSRTLKNGFIGLCFGPLVHQYYEFSDAILPVEGGLANRASKILMDQTIYLTVKCSIYISAVGLLAGDDVETVKGNVKERIGPVVITAWKFWPLVHCITYGLIPARHRILWVNSVDLIWNAILASKAQGDDKAQGDGDNGNVAKDQVVVCDVDEQLIESIITTTETESSDSQDVLDVDIQAQRYNILPSPPEEISVIESSLSTNSSTNCTNAVAQAA